MKGMWERLKDFVRLNISEYGVAILIILLIVVLTIFGDYQCEQSSYCRL